MTLTLLDVVCRICRHVGLDPGLDTFSEDDESLALVQFVNEAYERLLDDLPDDIPYKNQRATLTTVAGQRTYDLPSDAWAFDLDDWSLVLDETGDAIPDGRLSWLPRHAVASLDAAYAADDSSRYGRPRIAYVEGDNQVAFYPVPDGGYAITYTYGQHLTNRLVNPTDTFVLPDIWVRYIEQQAQALYERNKGYDTYAHTQMTADDTHARIMAQAMVLSPTFLQGGF